MDLLSIFMIIIGIITIMALIFAIYAENDKEGLKTKNKFLPGVLFFLTLIFLYAFSLGGQANKGILLSKIFFNEKTIYVSEFSLRYPDNPDKEIRKINGKFWELYIKDNVPDKFKIDIKNRKIIFIPILAVKSATETITN